MASNQLAFNGNKTLNQYNLKAGDFFVYARPTVYEGARFVATSGVLTAAVDEAATSIVTVTDISAEVGDVFCVARTKERMICTTATTTTPFTTIFVRGVDGAEAQAIGAGYKISKVGHALRNGAAVAVNGQTTLTIADYSANAEIVATDRLVLRRGFNIGSTERMSVQSLATTNLEVIRNINYHKDEWVLPDTSIAVDEFLFVCSEDWYPPEIQTWLDSQKYKLLENLGGVTITEEEATVETMSDQRRGDYYKEHKIITVAFDNPIVQAELLGLLNPNSPAVVGSAPSGVQDFVGVSLDTNKGEQCGAFTLFIKGRETIANNQLSVVLHKAERSASGDINGNSDQRKQSGTYVGAFSRAMGSVGFVRDPLVC